MALDNCKLILKLIEQTNGVSLEDMLSLIESEILDSDSTKTRHDKEQEKKNEKKQKKEFAKEVGKRVKFYRNLRGYTLADMEDMTEFTGPYISYIENSVNIPSSYTIWVLANTLNVPFKDFFPDNSNKLQSSIENDSILEEEDFKPYLDLAKKAYKKGIDIKLLKNAIGI